MIVAQVESLRTFLTLGLGWDRMAGREAGTSLGL